MQTEHVVRPTGAFNLEIHSVLYYAGHILALYIGQSVIDVFRVNGPLVERLEINEQFEKVNLKAV